MENLENLFEPMTIIRDHEDEKSNLFNHLGIIIEISFYGSRDTDTLGSVECEESIIKFDEDTNYIYSKVSIKNIDPVTDHMYNNAVMPIIINVISDLEERYEELITEANLINKGCAIIVDMESSSLITEEQLKSLYFEYLRYRFSHTLTDFNFIVYYPYGYEEPKIDDLISLGGGKSKKKKKKKDKKKK